MTARPRALQVCPNDHPPFLELCRSHAAAMTAAGCEVDTVFFGAPRATRWDAATYFGIGRGTRAMIAALRRHCAAKSYRLVVMHRYRAYQVATRARLAAADYVAVAHEFGMFERRRRRTRQRLLARDVVFAGVSQAVVDEMHRQHPLLRRTLVLPNPIDVAASDRERLSRADARAELDVADESYALGIVGRLHPEKRPLLALEAFAGAALPADAKLVFVGDGVLRNVLEARARELGIAARVRFVGRVVAAARYLAAFDVLPVTSGPTEAFGMTVLEGMLAGVPIVCADQAGPRSVLGPDGRYFSGGVAELTAELGRVAALPRDDLEQLCRMQRARAEREFSVPAVAEVYRRLLNTAAARPSVAS